MIIWWQAAIISNCATALVGYICYRAGLTEGWHRGSSDTAAYVANEKRKT